MFVQAKQVPVDAQLGACGVQELTSLYLVVRQGCNERLARLYWERRLPVGRRSRASGPVIADSMGSAGAGWKPALPVDTTRTGWTLAPTVNANCSEFA